MIERPAKGTVGFIIIDMDTHQPVFRVYTEDQTGFRTGWVDYDISHAELHVAIVDESAAFYEGDDVADPFLDYTSKILGRPPQQQK